MNDRFNTIAGWVLFAGIVALGSSVASYKYFHADKPERPDQLGYIIEGVEEELDSVVVDVSIAEALNMMSADEQIAAGQRVFANVQPATPSSKVGLTVLDPTFMQ